MNKVSFKWTDKTKAYHEKQYFDENFPNSHFPMNN